MIKILCVGKIKEKFFRDAIDEYTKRLSKYTKLEIIEVADNESIDKEKDLLLKHINEKDYIITLEIEGKELTSPELSKKIEDIFMINSNITFIIYPCTFIFFR